MIDPIDVFFSLSKFFKTFDGPSMSSSIKREIWRHFEKISYLGSNLPSHVTRNTHERGLLLSPQCESIPRQIGH